MRRPLPKLVAVCVLLALVAPRPRSVSPPLVSPTTMTVVQRDELAAAIRQKLDEQAYIDANTTTTTPATTSTTTRRRPAASSSARGPMDGDRFDRLAACESGGDPTRVDKTGRYRGAFQWLLSTWHAAGGTGDPIDVSYVEQKRIAMSWAQRSNPFGQWPACWPKSA